MKNEEMKSRLIQWKFRKTFVRLLSAAKIATREDGQMFIA